MLPSHVPQLFLVPVKLLTFPLPLHNFVPLFFLHNCPQPLAALISSYSHSFYPLPPQPPSSTITMQEIKL